MWNPFLMPLRLIDNISMGTSLHSVAVSRDGAQLYVALDDENSISIVDLATGGVAGRVRKLSRPRFQLPRLVGLVTVIDIDTQQVTQTLEFDGNGYRMAMSRDGSRVYDGDTHHNQIVVFAVE